MVARERAERVPGDLRVVMAMIVDKAGRNDLTAGIDGLAGRAGELAELGDLAVLDRDVAAKRRHTRAVDDQPILDQQVIRHLCPSSIALRKLLLLVADYSMQPAPAAPGICRVEREHVRLAVIRRRPGATGPLSRC